MIPAPSSARLHLAALLLLAGCAVLAWCGQARPVLTGAAAVAAAPPPGAPAASALLWGGRVDLNLADADDLAALPGIGPVRAARILSTRTARGGRFDRVDDLLDGPGIGPVTLERLRPHVHVE